MDRRNTDEHQNPQRRTLSFDTSYPVTWSRNQQNHYQAPHFRPIRMSNSLPTPPEITPPRYLPINLPAYQPNLQYYEHENSWTHTPSTGDVVHSEPSPPSPPHSRDTLDYESDGHTSTDDEELVGENDEGPSIESSNRFNPIQARLLVEKWSRYIKKLESSESLKYWKIIQEEINKVGRQKSVKQIKRKMLALKADYKKAKANNSRSGRARKTSKFYEEIDAIMGTRDVVSMPFAFSSGQPENLDVPTQEPVVATENNGDNTPTDNQDDADAPPRPPKKKRKSKNDAVASVNQTMVEMQEKQEEFNKTFFDTFFDKMVAMEERAQEKNNDFLLKLVEAMKK